jgi:hypothetical protein
MKKKLKVELSKVDRLGLTTDLWTSSNQTPFMVVSAHYIHWTLKKKLISFKELPTPHTGVAIADQLIATIVNWKILEKVASITVDNASSNDVAIARVASILSTRSSTPPDMNGQYFHIRCAAHIINLVVKDGLKNLSAAINKIRDCVRYSKSSPSRKQLFKEAIDHTNMKRQALPSVDVPTRWNSTYLMLQSTLPYKEAFETLAVKDANFTHCPTFEEWDELSKMTEFLKIFNTG